MRDEGESERRVKFMKNGSTIYSTRSIIYSPWSGITTRVEIKGIQSATEGRTNLIYFSTHICIENAYNRLAFVTIFFIIYLFFSLSLFFFSQ